MRDFNPMVALGSSTLNPPGLHEVEAAVRSVLGAMVRVEPSRVEPWVFGGRLLSLRHAEEFSTGLREVRLAPGTVITPLAKDHLKRAGIEIRWVSRSEAEQVRNAGEWGFSIDSETRTGLLEALRRSLLEGQDAWRELGGSLDLAAGWVTESGSRGALIFTSEASTAVYRACRMRGIRASSAADPDAVARAVLALGANMVIVEPSGKSIALMRQIGSTFRRAGGPIVPEWIREGATS